MLRLIIEQKEADLGDIAGISLRYNSRVFDFATNTSSYAIPFSLPYSDRNNEIFEFQNSENARNTEIIERDCELWHSGLLIYSGIIKASAYDNSISCNFFPDDGSFLKKLKEKPLHQHDFGGSKTFFWRQEYDWTTDDFLLFEVYNPTFFKDTEWEGPDYFTYRQNPYAGTFEFVETDRRAITPFPVLWRVLKYLFENLGYQYTDDYFTIGDMMKLVIFNVNSAVKMKDNLGSGNYTIEVTDYDLANHLPEMPAENFILALQNFYNIFFYQKADTVTIIDRKLMIQSTDFEDYSEKRFSKFKKTLSESKTGFNIAIQLDSNDQFAQTIDRTNNYNRRYAQSSSELPEPMRIGDTLYATDLNNFHKAVNLDWQGMFPYYDDNILQDVANVNEDIIINTGLSSLISRNRQTGATYRTVLESAQNGNSFLSAKLSPFSLRLMLYDGIREIYDIHDDILIYEENKPCGSFQTGTLELSGRWAYQNRYVDFLSWYLESSQVSYEAEFQLSASEIKNFNPILKKKIDNNLYYITNFEVFFGRNSISPIKAKLIKANY